MPSTERGCPVREGRQRIAADAHRLGFDAITVPEPVVLPREVAGQIGRRCPCRP
jgi:hypothetical protein